MHLIFGVAGGILLAVWVLNGCPGLRQIVLGTLAIGALAIVAILACVYLPQIHIGHIGGVIGAVIGAGLLNGMMEPRQNAKPLPAATAAALPAMKLLPYYPAPRRPAPVIPPRFQPAPRPADPRGLFPAGLRRTPMARTSLG